MRILRVTLRLLILLGINPSLNELRWYGIVKWLYVSVLVYNLIPQVIFLRNHMSDVLGFTEAIPLFLENLGMLCKFLILIYNVEPLRHIFKALLVYAEQRSSVYVGTKNQKMAEKFINRIYKVYGSVIFGSWFWLVVPPGIIQFYNFLRGTATDGTYKEPFTNQYWFDNSVRGIYQTFYVLASIAIGSVSYSLVAIDVLFSAICLHITSVVKDFQEFIEELDLLLKENRNSQLPVRTEILDEHFKKILDFHNKLIKFVKKFSNCFSGVVAVGYTQAAMNICCCIFQTLIIDLNTPVVLKNVNFFIAATTQLLVYCWFGEIVTNEFFKVSETFAGLNWTTYPSSIKKGLVLALQQTNTAVIIKGFNFFNCNMESFVNILNTAVSSLAVLQSLK